MNYLEIPKKSDKELQELYMNIKPIVTLGDIKYSLREFSLEELRKISYIYHVSDNVREVIDKDKLETIKDINCLHTWAYYGLFKPTISEVLSQIPTDLVNKVNLFEIVDYIANPRELHEYRNIINKGYHLSKVRTYKYHK